MAGRRGSGCGRNAARHDRDKPVNFAGRLAPHSGSATARRRPWWSLKCAPGGYPKERNVKLTRSLDGHSWCRAFLGGLALLAFSAIFTSPSQRAAAHETGYCAGKNWCERRTHTCGPSTGYGRCLISRWGQNMCAEILFQVPNCNECAEPNCTNCICILGAGGGDKCNNGASGYDYVCVRRLATQ
jgi:hypothetical protein